MLRVRAFNRRYFPIKLKYVPIDNCISRLSKEVVALGEKCIYTRREIITTDCNQENHFLVYSTIMLMMTTLLHVITTISTLKQ